MNRLKVCFYILLLALTSCKKPDDEVIDIESVVHNLTITYNVMNPERYKQLFFINDIDGKLIKTIDPTDSTSTINLSFISSNEQYILSYAYKIGKFDGISDSILYMNITSWINFDAQTFNTTNSQSNVQNIIYQIEFINYSENIRLIYPGGYNELHSGGLKSMASTIENPKIILIKGWDYNQFRNEDYDVMEIKSDTVIDLNLIEWKPVIYKTLYYQPIDHFSQQSFYYFLMPDSTNLDIYYYINSDYLSSENGSFDIRYFPELSGKEEISFHLSNFMNDSWSYTGIYNNIPDNIELYNAEYSVNLNENIISINTPIDCNVAQLNADFKKPNIYWSIVFPGGKTNVTLIEFPELLKKDVSISEADLRLSSLSLHQYKDYFNYSEYASQKSQIGFGKFWLLRSVNYSLNK